MKEKREGALFYDKERDGMISGSGLILYTVDCIVGIVLTLPKHPEEAASGRFCR